MLLAILKCVSNEVHVQVGKIEEWLDIFLPRHTNTRVHNLGVRTSEQEVLELLKSLLQANSVSGKLLARFD